MLAGTAPRERVERGKEEMKWQAPDKVLVTVKLRCLSYRADAQGHLQVLWAEVPAGNEKGVGNEGCPETAVADMDSKAAAVSSAKAEAVLSAKSQTFTSGKAAVAPPLAADGRADRAGDAFFHMHQQGRADPLKPDQ